MEKFTLKAQVFYMDGTSSSIQSPLSQTTGLSVGSVVSYPSGFTQLGLNLVEPLKTPDYYQLWLVNNNGGVVTSKRTFYLREAEYDELDLWFQNSLGVVEAVALRTGHTYGVAIDKKAFLKATPFDTSNTVHELASGDPELVEKFATTTGFMGRKEIMPYIDMLMSRRVWWIHEGLRIPVTIAGGLFEIVKPSIARGEYEFAINFSFTKAFSQNAFSSIDA